MLLSDRMRMTYRLLLTVLALLLTGKSVLAQDDSVWVIPIEGEINSATAQYISSRIADANEERPLALQFHIDTPGGLVSAMEDIVDALLTQPEVPTLAEVSIAFSARPLIPLSAQELATVLVAPLGAAM